MRWPVWLATGIAVHCLVGAIRLPRACVKRWADVAGIEEQGAVRWRFERAFLERHDVIESLLATTPDNAVIAFRGAPKGALEYAAALLWPRVCCFEDRLPRAETTHRGRPIAPVVLVANGAALQLVPR